MNTAQFTQSPFPNAVAAQNVGRRSSRLAAAFKKSLRMLCSGRGRLLFSIPLYRLGWRLRGLDFGYASVNELGLSAENSNQHMDGGGPLLFDMVRQLRVSAADVALDLGS